MASPAAIEVEHISKRFRVFREKPTSIKQRLLTARPALLAQRGLKHVEADDGLDLVAAPRASRHLEGERGRIGLIIVRVDP